MGGFLVNPPIFFLRRTGYNFAVSRGSVNLVVGVLIGACAAVVVAKLVHDRRQQDPRLIARKLGKKISTLESRVESGLRATAG
jgi:hypothetical protein